MKFRKYQHIERFGSEEVEGIEIGECFVYPKIDGTNASCWLDNGEVKAGSRNRELTLDKDNQGFYKYILENENIKRYLETFPCRRLYGEWLVPHSLKTYREDAWKKFYVFDVLCDFEDEHEYYINYKEYSEELDFFGIDYIAPIRIIKNGNLSNFEKCLDENDYLIKNGCGNGEGIVIKNYDYVNKYGRKTWAKIVTSEFKEKHRRNNGVLETEKHVIE